MQAGYDPCTCPYSILLAAPDLHMRFPFNLQAGSKASRRERHPGVDPQTRRTSEEGARQLRAARARVTTYAEDSSPMHGSTDEDDYIVGPDHGREKGDSTPTCLHH